MDLLLQISKIFTHRSTPPAQEQNPGDKYIPFETKEGLVELQNLIGQHGKDIAKQKRDLGTTNNLIKVFLIVCFLGFITFLLDAWRFHYEVYGEYVSTIKSLIEENQDLREKQMLEKIDELQRKVDSLNQPKVSVSASVSAQLDK